MGIEDVGTTLQEALDDAGPNLSRRTLESAISKIDPKRSIDFSQFIFGSITWSTDLGRPDLATMAAGFGIKHEYWKIYAVGVGEGRVHISASWQTTDDVSSYDAPDVGAKHHVSFVADWHGFAANRLSVALLPVPWRDRSPFAGVRVVRPPSYLVDRPAPLRFLEFEVVGIPHIDIERAGTLPEP